MPLSPFKVVDLEKPAGGLQAEDCLEKFDTQGQRSRGDDSPHGESPMGKDKGVYVGIEDDMSVEEDTNSDGLGDIWRQMELSMELSKEDTAPDSRPDEQEAEDGEVCAHSFMLQDDIGEVCCHCGIIGRSIESIIEYNFAKAPRSSRTYTYEGQTAKEDMDQSNIIHGWFQPSTVEFAVAQVNPHPWHRREMMPHQVEGFNFLVSNLVGESPGGCILAHAPGSGKTFMIISFLQSFMAKYPSARALVVLPKGIVPIWKQEFKKWAVENLPLYDFYSVKADNRARQLDVLTDWARDRSILFLGYQQFSSIISDSDTNQIPSACQEILLTCPSIMILDEGHTPRNQDTDVLTSLAKVQTKRKVVLSGTLYQNHVKEVFNIVHLVCPRFLKKEYAKVIKRRILSRVEISGKKNVRKVSDDEFYDLIEHTLVKDENQKRKVSVIQDLRELTKNVLHYYKGDNLDELPGLVDFCVFLELSSRQKAEVTDLKKFANRFKISSEGSAIYVHPELKTLSKNSEVKDTVLDGKIDGILEKLDVTEGVKATFYLNLLQLCDSSSEKLLVFSQYLLPLKFLERLTAKVKGYSLGKEMFMITGNSDAETRNSSMDRFNNSSDARVFFGSIKACGEGISLVGASRIVILDVHLNPSVTRQVIGRAFRPGQIKKVYAYRLVASASPEEDDHKICFRKESIAKMWFEWDELSCRQNLEMQTVGVDDCEDLFLEAPRLSQDINAVLKS